MGRSYRTAMSGFVCLAIALAPGCDKLAKPTMQTPFRYYVTYLNKTGHEIYDVRLYYGEKQIGGAGTMVVGADKTEGEIDVAIPAEAEIRWQENGESQAAKAKL